MLWNDADGTMCSLELCLLARGACLGIMGVDGEMGEAGERVLVPGMARTHTKASAFGVVNLGCPRLALV